MKIIGITGGVGAGKSTVLDFLEKEFQAEIVKTDEAGHLVMEPGRPSYGRILEIFGREILAEDETIDRGKLGAMVFREQDLLRKLSAIIHPAVKAYVLERLQGAREAGRKLFVIESALIFEDDYDAICDEVWYIYAGEATRSVRLQAQRGYTQDRIRGIMANQAQESFFREHCDFVVENDGDFSETCRHIRERIQIK